MGTGDTRAGVLPVVKVDVGGQGGRAHPAQRFARVACGMWVGSRVEWSEARIRRQDVQVALHAAAVCWHACSGRIFSTAVACYAGDGSFGRICMGSM